MINVDTYALDPRWKWRVICMYNEEAKYPHQEGEILSQTVHASDYDKDLKLKEFKERDDVKVFARRLR
jgi:hypothetical protein